jgi:hypothetical protein
LDQLFVALLTTANEILTAGIVIIAASLLLYNLTRNLHDRVARTSGVVLGALTFVYICDTLISLSPGIQTYTNLLRAQWLGIAFMPVALYHLSDALLATTGLPSRGRRRRVIRILYVIALVFFLLATYTDIIIRPVIIASPILMGGRQIVTLDDGGGFPIYLAYFVIVTGAAFLNVQRARDRCIARSTRRRMGYLLIAMTTPAIGVFPFALLLETGAEISLLGLALVNAANIVVILMLIFLAYPLSFFGSRIPDRLVKTELLRFLLRGPGTGLLALGAIVLTTSGFRVLGVTGVEFMPFAVVAVVLLWQWGVALSLPHIERYLIYPGEDAERIARLQQLGDRLLTRDDLLQLLDAILASTCDYLRVSSAFVASLPRAGIPGAITASQGPMIPDAGQIDRFPALTSGGETLTAWNGFWLAPLITRRGTGGEVIGVFGIQARAGQIDLTEDDRRMFTLFLERAAQALDDLALQAELFSVLEGLLPQVVTTRARTAALEYRPGHPSPGTDTPQPPVPHLAQPDDHDDEALFKEQVRAALRHYWGGPGLTSSRLLDTELVRRALNEQADTPANALRAVLLMGIEKLRPDGERKYHLPEWMLYNLLELRFVQQMMVRDVAQKLAMGESDLYRKQRIAIDQLADILWRMERDLKRS